MVCRKDTIVGGKGSIFDAQQAEHNSIEAIFSESCDLLSAQIKDNIALSDRLMTMIEELEQRLGLSEQQFLEIIPVNRDMVSHASKDWQEQSTRRMNELRRLVRMVSQSRGSSGKMQRQAVFNLVSVMRKECDSYEEKAGYWMREVQMVARATRDRQSMQAYLDRAASYLAEQEGKIDGASSADRDFMARMSHLRDICTRLIAQQS